MRNAGDGTPGGSTGRRQRVPAPAGTARPTGNGGASLFTPAYRVRHADAPSSPAAEGFSTQSQRATDTGYGGSPTGQQGADYRWSEFDQPSASYRQADYGSGSRDSAWADDLQRGGYSRLTGDQGTGSGWPGYSGDGALRVGNAIRGLPPVADEPLPTYPPGPFAAWNRGPSDRGDARASAATAAADLLEPPNPSRRPTAREDSSRMLATATITPDEFDTNHSLPAIKDPVLTQGRSAIGVADRASAAGSRSGSRAGTARSRAAAPARDRARAGRGKAGRSEGSKRTHKGSKRHSVRLAIGVAAVIIAAVAAILVITSLNKPGANSSANNNQNRPRASTSPTPAAPGGKWGYIRTRRTDPVPLQLTELFPSSFISGGVKYYVAITKLGHNCRAALIGTALQTAVRQAHCSQVLRASYVSRPEKAMATIGVFNLATSAEASAAARHAGPAEFIADLPGKTGVTSSLGQGSGLEEAVVKGHYLVLAWAENIDLAAPTTQWQRQHLTGFMRTLIQATINNSLSYRMVDGRPAPPG